MSQPGGSTSSGKRERKGTESHELEPRVPNFSKLEFRRSGIVLASETRHSPVPERHGPGKPCAMPPTIPPLADLVPWSSRGHDAPMELDSFWRTRTLSEAMGQGYAFLRLTCSCGRTTDYPFPLLLQRRGVI